MKSIQSLVEECHNIALQKDWWAGEERNFGELLCLIHAEISETLEEYRNHKGFDEIYFNGEKPEGIPIELADVLIRIFDLCGKYDIPLEKAIDMKIEYNKTRPSRHGGKRA